MKFCLDLNLKKEIIFPLKIDNEIILRKGELPDGCSSSDSISNMIKVEYTLYDSTGIKIILINEFNKTSILKITVPSYKEKTLTYLKNQLEFLNLV